MSITNNNRYNLIGIYGIALCIYQVIIKLSVYRGLSDIEVRKPNMEADQRFRQGLLQVY